MVPEPQLWIWNNKPAQNLKKKENTEHKVKKRRPPPLQKLLASAIFLLPHGDGAVLWAAATDSCPHIVS